MENYCANCGHKLNEEADYCLGCGIKLKKQVKQQKIKSKKQNNTLEGILSVIFSFISLSLIIFFNLSLSSNSINEISNYLIDYPIYFQILNVIFLNLFAIIPGLIGLILSIDQLKVKKTNCGVIGLTLALSSLIICLFTSFLFF